MPQISAGRRPPQFHLMGLPAVRARLNAPCTPQLSGWLWRNVADHLRHHAHARDMGPGGAGAPGRAGRAGERAPAARESREGVAWSSVPTSFCRRRSRHRIKETARRAAIAGTASAAAWQAINVVTVLSEGFTLPLTLPVGAASLLYEKRYFARLAFELVTEIARLYGVPFKLEDEGEMATVLDIVFPWRTTDGKGVVAALAQQQARSLGKKLIVDALVRSVPLLAGPCRFTMSYRDIAAIGQRAIAGAERRRTLRVAVDRWLGCTDAAMLLDGAYALTARASSVNHDVVLTLALIASRASHRPVFEGADGWLARTLDLPEHERSSLIESLEELHDLMGDGDPARAAVLARFGNSIVAGQKPQARKALGSIAPPRSVAPASQGASLL